MAASLYPPDPSPSPSPSTANAANTKDALKATHISESVWRQILAEPFECERRMREDDSFEHNYEIILVASGRMPDYIYQGRGKGPTGPNKCPRPTWELIGQVMFVWTNAERGTWDEAEWLCIGKTANSKSLYFAYRSNRDGTGFGFNETSTLFVATTFDDLFWCALTDRQRILVLSANSTSNASAAIPTTLNASTFTTTTTTNVTKPDFL